MSVLNRKQNSLFARNDFRLCRNKVQALAHDLESTQGAIQMFSAMGGGIAGSQQSPLGWRSGRHHRIGVDTFFNQRVPSQADAEIFAQNNWNDGGVTGGGVIAQILK